MSINNFSSSSEGYGRLDQDQTKTVDANKAKIDNANISVGVSKATVAGVKTGSAELQQRVSNMAPKINEMKAEQGEKLTKTQQKILSNLKTEAKEFKKENKIIEKELSGLEKSAGKAVSKLKIDEKEIGKSSQKVESYKGERNFGQTNPLFGTKKTDRVVDSGNREMAAAGKAAESKTTAMAFTAKNLKAEGEVSAQAAKIKDFESLGKEKLTLAKDVHTAIKGAEKQYEDLVSKYENRKDSLAKTQRKLSDSGKADIKNDMAKLKEQISGLKNLEKALGKEKVDVKEIRSELESNQTKISKKSGEITELIATRSSEKMSFSDRIKHAVKDLFVSNSKSESELNAGELATLAKLYPGMDPKEAMKEYGRRFQESLNPGKTADGSTNLPPQIEEDNSFSSDLPPEEDNSFPTYLPPTLEEEDNSFPTYLPPTLPPADSPETTNVTENPSDQ